MTADQVTFRSFLAALQDAGVGWSETDLTGALELVDSMEDDATRAADAIWRWCEARPSICEAVERHAERIQEGGAPAGREQLRLPGEGGRSPTLTTPVFRTTVRNGVLTRRGDAASSEGHPTSQAPERGGDG